MRKFRYYLAVSRRVQQGFNIIEVMVVVALIGIALAIAVPSMAALIRSNRTTSEISTLVSSIRMAKSEAIKRGSAVQICSTTDASTCSGTNVWNTGWLIYVDSNGNGSLDSGEEIITTEQAFKYAHTLLASSNSEKIDINRDGFAVNLPSTGKIIYTLTTSPADNNAKRCLSIDLSGNAVVGRHGDANCE
ncbi:MAG: GspH/FimT family pseudopilin [Comamonas sp.]|uniref:GspH/FimT family pseudopilin n=1 Tax=Comamonas sp. TaxID=34028 RepID=UPI003D0D693C